MSRTQRLKGSRRWCARLGSSLIVLASGCLLNGCSGKTGAAGASDSPAAVNNLAANTANGTSGTKASGNSANAAFQNYPAVTSQTAAADHANELGRVLILEYHNIIDKKGQFNQSPAQLRGDLQRLYDHGYCTLDIHDYTSGNITTPAGKSPVILTFDDASKYQFRYLEQGGKTVIDPDCAVGILDSFGAAHPDFGNHATFFVLPSGFEQPAYKAEKYRYLLSHGYAVQNHTWTHPIMTHLTPDRVQEELGRDDADIHAILPDDTVDVLAYPFGTRPTVNHKPDPTHIRSGEWQGHPYQIKAALLVGSEPAPSPYSARLNWMAIPRVQAIEPDLIRWITYFDNNPHQKFISDGNPNTVSIPASRSADLSATAVGTRKVITY